MLKLPEGRNFGVFFSSELQIDLREFEVALVASLYNPNRWVSMAFLIDFS